MRDASASDLRAGSRKISAVQVCESHHGSATDEKNILTVWSRTSRDSLVLMVMQMLT